MFLTVLLSALIGGPALAWWPWTMPALVRKAGTCLALAPGALGFLFGAYMLFTRPSQLIAQVAPLLLAFVVMLVAGAYAMWPRAVPRHNRAIAGLFFVGPVLGFFALAGIISTARAGTVVGKVTFKGQPVPSGQVSIMSDEGVVCTGVIRPDGRYTVYRVPPGPVKIAVSASPPPPPGPVPVMAPKYVAIPLRYRDFDKSNLTRIVTQGGQRQNLDLQP